jgi:hypothetical protein
MIEVVYCMRRKAGMSHQEFADYWERVHAPIVMENLHLLRLHGYERTVPVRHEFSDKVERRRTMLEPFDGIARLTWASEEDMRLAFTSPAALDVQRRLAIDEAEFVDPSASCRWVAQTKKHVEGGWPN